ncbi:MAG: hypothetical protein ACFFC7_33165 [Candidatus Hermodarchaeota archaeon]
MLKLSPEILEKLDNKPVVFVDRKYLFVRYDHSNFAILEQSKLKKVKHISSAQPLFYPDFVGGLKALLLLRTQDDLLFKVKQNDTYSSLDKPVKDYLLLSKQGQKEALSQLKQNKQQLIEDDIF